MLAAAIPDGFLPLDLLQHLFFHASAVVADGDPKFLLFFSHNHKNLDLGIGFQGVFRTVFHKVLDNQGRNPLLHDLLLHVVDEIESVGIANLLHLVVGLNKVDLGAHSHKL